MTEEYWQKWKTTRDARHPNLIWKTMETKMRVDAITNQHPDNLYALCRTDNNYWRHYRASPKLGIDELAMMICREVGCDLQYCQTLFAKPKHPNQQINNCDSQFDNFRTCIIREKRIFRSLMGEIDISKDTTTIPDYLEKHFKEKEKMKKERKMMGLDGEDLKAKIQEMDEKASLEMNKVKVGDFKRKKQEVMDQSYM